jgi:Uma2 family endonuclease
VAAIQPIQDLERPLTYDDFLALPDDGNRYEIINGELIVSASPRRDHQEVSASLDWILQRFLHETGMGRLYTHPIDVKLGPNDIVEPDLVVILTARLETYLPQGVVVAPPDLVVEIISPSSSRTDHVRKMALYARSGVPEYWIADPGRRTLTIYVLEGDRYRAVEPDADGLLPSRILPGLRVDPAEVFIRLD